MALLDEESHGLLNQAQLVLIPHGAAHVQHTDDVQGLSMLLGLGLGYLW